MRNKSTCVAACHRRGRLPNVHFTDVATGAFNMVTEQRPVVHPDLPPVGLMEGLGWGEVSQTPVVSGSPIISWAAAPGPMGNGDGSPQSLPVQANLPLCAGSGNVLSDPRLNVPIKHKAIFRASQAFVIFNFFSPSLIYFFFSNPQSACLFKCFFV